jgi:hypothetical protein
MNFLFLLTLGSSKLKSSVRAAIDSLMADDISRPVASHVAKHLKMALDSDSVEDKLRHVGFGMKMK